MSISSANQASIASLLNYAINAKGDLLVGTADDNVSNLAVGTNNFVLTADSTTATGLKWATTQADATKIPLATVTTAGDLIVGTGSSAVSRLGVGTSSQILIGGSTPTWSSVPNAALVSVPNSSLANSSVTINGTAISLGGSATITADFASSAISSNVTLAGLNKYFVDTTAARTLTLPASPGLGLELSIFDATGSAATNNITVNSNSSKINGSVQNLTIDVAYAAVTLVYTGSTYGWRVS